MAEGTYAENLRFNGKNIILRSNNPMSPEVVKSTIIDGDQSGSVITFSGDEDETCRLSGFTIQKGSAFYGGGIAGHGTHATIKGNIITSNSADMTHGGGVHGCDGMIEGNVISSNSSNYFGGGLAFCDGVIPNNLILRNSTQVGGGLICCSAVIRNTTIVGNSGTSHGGSVAASEGTVLNCILWGNASGHDAEIHKSRGAAYSCVQGGAEGEGNISENPGFVTGGYGLEADSPCIDAGENEVWMQHAFDLDGNLRIWGGTVDMGAYEYGSFPFAITQVARLTETEITWKSRPGDSYIVWSCSDLSGGDSWSQEATVESQGEATTYSDPDMTSLSKFYKIEIE